MHRFEAVLKRVGARLDLPYPARSRVLWELSSDLDDLYRAYRARGLGDEEAASRAEVLLAPSPGSLEALERVHAPLYRRLLARLSSRTRHRVERALLVAVAAATLTAGGAGLADVDALADPSPFLWPVLGIGAAVAAFGVVKLFWLYVKRDHAPKRLRAGLSSLLALGVASVGAGAIGFVLDTYRLAGAVAGAADRQLPLVLRWIRQDATLLVVSLLGALAAALAWFLCLRRVVAIEADEAAIVDASPSAGRDGWGAPRPGREPSRRAPVSPPVRPEDTPLQSR